MKKFLLIITLTLLLSGCRAVTFTIGFGDDLPEATEETEESEGEEWIMP